MYYWLYQVKHNDELMLPDYGKRTFSSTYVEDLVETIISALNSNISCETYNVISTPKTSIKQLVSAASELLNKNLVEVNATAHFLETHQIQEWTDLPLWLNSDYYTYSNQKLIEHLAFEPTPFKQSILDTIRYFSGLNWPVPTYGIDDNRSRELLSLLLKSQ
jgi:nucleoside-diphosphate-sugar epimerase